MPTAELLLDKLPDPVRFYKEFWNKKPFIVKNAIDADIMDGLITADELAGLSLEEDIRSRIVCSGKWSCEHGPFSEEKFSTLGEENWSLLVQNVEIHHPPTKKILSSFQFSPSWLIDDVMVSYSTPGGGVGPHLDSYHVFLIQGSGKRRWKIGTQAIDAEKFIDNLDLKILKHEFDGETFEVEQGDVIYIPPYFPHSGETLKEALTFSIGFLGPSLSELLVEYGHYIEEQGEINKRYDGNELNITSSGDQMSGGEVNNFRSTLTDAIGSDHFEKWLKRYFSSNEDY